MIVKTPLGGFRRQLLSYFHRRLLPLEHRAAAVSFCFDDFPRTAYTAGGSILKSYDCRGTYYASLGLLNTTNELGEQMRPDDLESVLADGHELGSHTFSHSSCRRVPSDVFEKDVIKGRETIRRITGCDAASFAYPYGHVTLSAKAAIGKHMNSCRGIYGGVNRPTADLNLLRANSLYGDLDQSATAESLLQDNQRVHGWLIFYTHDVCRNPSRFGCTPALLDKVVSLAVEMGLRIAPIGEIVAPILQLGSRPSS
jgi:peptidoglycan/xylan/chitin deacetylase (PgdA/CDA1 family)